MNGQGMGRGGGRGMGRAGGQGRKRGSKAAGPDGYCNCPKCGHRMEHITGQPCYEKKCPRCGTQMVRE